MALILLRILYVWKEVTFIDGLGNDAFSRAISQNVGAGIGLYLTALAILFAIICVFAFPKIESFISLMQKKTQELKTETPKIPENTAPKTMEKPFSPDAAPEQTHADNTTESLSETEKK